MKKWIKSVVFLLIGGILFGMVQEVLTQKYKNENTNYSISGIDALEPNTLSVLFAGSSPVLLGVSPMQIYEDLQICTYNLSTAGQPIDFSYFLIKRILKNQQPSIVVLDVGSLFGDAKKIDQTKRYVLDNLPLDENKLEMIAAYGAVENGDGMVSALFPIVKFHTRWNELTKSDFQIQKRQSYYSAGQYLVGLISPNNASLSDVNASADEMTSRNQDKIVYYMNGKYIQDEINTPYYTQEISEYNLEYLLKIQLLCKEIGADLILVKIPMLQFPQNSTSAWTRQKYEIVKEVAEKYNLQYIDLMFDVDVGVDFMTDSYDGGSHLNVLGAEKVTAYLESFLSENYKIEEKRNPTWDEMLEKYRKVLEIAHINLEMDFTTYIENLINNMDRWDILIAASTDYVLGLNESDFAQLSQLGLNLISEGHFADSYLTVIKNGDVEYEAYSGRIINYSTRLNNKEVVMQSSGWFTKSNASIKINGMEYSRNSAGLNIVVVDRETGLVIDSVCFNTHSEEKTATHYAGIHTLLHNYEAAVCFE